MHDKDNSIHDEYDTSENGKTIEIETYKHSGENIHETEESIPTETSQVLTVFNKAIHHEDDSSDDKSDIEIHTPLLILTATPLTVIRRLRMPISNPSHWHTR